MTYHPRSAKRQENPGPQPTWNPLAHLGLLQDDLYLYYTTMEAIIYLHSTSLLIIKKGIFTCPHFRLALIINLSNPGSYFWHHQVLRSKIEHPTVQSVRMDFVHISEQTVTTSQYSINRLVLINET